ncbi:MAG TPA: septal ring lytic transglycosylase RlpA family protein [Burkholderiales bacterium]|nr:septal ring lytic transglycosylase RlpA family protein [Burkholderiales bacterium]
MRRAALALLFLLSACGTISKRETPTPAAPPPGPGKGAYYKDDGPGANPPANLAAIPDAVPRAEPLNRLANRPYQALGRDYVPLTSVAPFRQSGVASWYGRRYHGQRTSSGEVYDMYAMTAAHPTLPIPSYARVTNLANGRSVVVRVNDRGPFHSDRIIDLSYVAAWKLGYADAGSAQVEVESVLPGAPASAVAAASTSAPAPAPPQEPPATEQKGTADAAGVYLQLGAFSSQQGAESFRARLYRELGWLSDAIRIVPAGAVYRLHLGPYRSPADARPTADRIAAELNLRPLIVIR